MEVSNEQILVAVNALSKTVEEYHGDFREFRGETKIKVSALEEAAKSARLWGNIKTVCVIPIVGLGHQIAAHFGWIR